MWVEIIFYNFFSLQSVKSFQYKRFIQTACLFFIPKQRKVYTVYVRVPYRTMEFTNYDRIGYSINYLRVHPHPPTLSTLCHNPENIKGILDEKLSIYICSAYSQFMYFIWILALHNSGWGWNSPIGLIRLREKGFFFAVYQSMCFLNSESLQHIIQKRYVSWFFCKSGKNAF